MDSSATVKVAAIICLSAIEVVNLLTARVDGFILLALGSLIGGIAGYHIRRRR
jgi:uncharacterized membrane-anchored protein